MAELNKSIGENNIENAAAFLRNKDIRTAPNKRVNEHDFFDIANSGAEKVKNELIRRNNTKR